MALPPDQDPAPSSGTAVSRDRGSNVNWILFSTILASSMAFIDGSALNVALPAIQAELGATGKQLLWIVNAYLLFLSSLILVGGSLGDLFGRRRVFMIGIGVFALASLACGLSPGSGVLIAARAVQGVGGALMVPGSLAIISACVPSGERGRAIGTWSAFTTMTTIVGPVLGGILASAGLWRGVFFINLPLAALSLVALALRVPETFGEETEELDLVGTLVVTTALAGLTYGAIEAPERGLTAPLVFLALSAGVGGLLAFVWIESRARSPMVPLGLFRSRTFGGANVVTLLLYGALNVAFFFFSLTLIQAQGYEARQAGFALLPFAVLLTLLSRWAGGLVDRYGARRPLVIGPATTALGFLALGLPGLASGASSYWSTYLPGVALIGLGMGLTVAPLTTAVMTSVPQPQVGVASGVNNAIARSAGVIAIAFVGGLALLSFRQTLAGQAQQLPLEPDQRTALIAEAEDLGEAEPPPSVPQELVKRVERSIRISLLTTFRRIAFLAAGLAGASSAIAALWVEGKGRHEMGG